MESTNSHGGEGANNNDETDDFVELTAAAPETNWASSLIMMPFERVPCIPVILSNRGFLGLSDGPNGVPRNRYAL